MANNTIQINTAAIEGHRRHIIGRRNRMLDSHAQNIAPNSLPITTGVVAEKMQQLNDEAYELARNFYELHEKTADTFEHIRRNFEAIDEYYANKISGGTS